ncbi:hypothetical protein JCM11641_004163 [Rhodosporidiobolus odoratus]
MTPSAPEVGHDEIQQRAGTEKLHQPGLTVEVERRQLRERSASGTDEGNHSFSSGGAESCGLEGGGSVVYHAGDSSGTFDSSFEEVTVDHSIDKKDNESSFEIILPPAGRRAEGRSSRSTSPQGSRPDTQEVSQDVEAPEWLLKHLKLDDKKDDDEDPGSHGLLNPEAPTFDFGTAAPHTLLFPPGTTFNDIVINGKDENGDLTADARAALTDLDLKIIPAMHGPLSLPYARCPSGIDAFLLPAAHEEDDPYPFIVDPDAPPPRPRGAAPPLPGNARFAVGSRSAQRFFSAPAALEKDHTRSLNPSGPLAAVPNASTAPGTRRKAGPTFSSAPRVTSQPPLGATGRQQKAIRQVKVAQQAQLAHHARVAQVQLGHGFPQPFHPAGAYHPSLASYPGGIVSPTSGVTAYPSIVAAAQHSYPYTPVQPYGLVSIPPRTTAALGAQTIQQRQAVQSRRDSLIGGGGYLPTNPALNPGEIDSLALLQIAARQQLNAAVSQGQGETCHSSYETAPDLAVSSDDEGETLDPQLNYDPGEGAEEQPGFFYPSLGRGQSGKDARTRTTSHPGQDYLQRRRQSAAPAFPPPGGRKPSLAPTVDVWPRRASIAPQARVVKEPTSVPLAAAAGNRPLAQSRKGSLSTSSHAGSANAPPAASIAYYGQGGSSRRPSQTAAMPPASSKGKGRVFGGEVGNTLSGSTRGGKLKTQPRHTSDATTTGSWRRRNNKDDSTHIVSKKVNSDTTVLAVAPTMQEGWHVVESVASALLSPSGGGLGASGEPTPVVSPQGGIQANDENASIEAGGTTGGNSQGKKTGTGKKYKKPRAHKPKGKTGVAGPVVA